MLIENSFFLVSLIWKSILWTSQEIIEMERHLNMACVGVRIFFIIKRLLRARGIISDLSANWMIQRKTTEDAVNYFNELMKALPAFESEINFSIKRKHQLIYLLRKPFGALPTLPVPHTLCQIESSQSAWIIKTIKLKWEQMEKFHNPPTQSYRVARPPPPQNSRSSECLIGTEKRDEKF